jgi:hypothetical protein
MNIEATGGGAAPDALGRTSINPKFACDERLTLEYAQPKGQTTSAPDARRSKRVSGHGN